jgi:hypothetical protein
MKPQETAAPPTPETEPGESDLLEIAVSPPLPERIEGIVVGRLLAAEGELRVLFPGAPPAGVPARAMVALSPADRGAEVALMFELGDPARPMVLGKMATGLRPEAAPVAPAPVEARRDGERLVLTAEQEIVLVCGDASITLTRAGKILLRGAYVSSRADGVNRIQGGSVEIN